MQRPQFRKIGFGTIQPSQRRLAAGQNRAQRLIVLVRNGRGQAAGRGNAGSMSQVGLHA
jgi:hypothetical protein